MFYRAYIFQNVNVSRFSKVKTKLKLFKGHQCLLSRVGLFPLEFLQRLKDSLKTGRLFHLGFFFVMSASIAVLRCGMPPNKQLLYPQLHCSSGVVVKNPPASVGDMGSISRLGRSSGGGNGNPLHYSCLEESHGQRSLAGYSP